MNDADAEEFDKFVARHWGKESVFSPEEYKEYMSEIEVYIHGNNQETQ
jgi:hypothetical protein